MSNSESPCAARQSPHALGCERPACCGSCLAPRDDDPLEVRIARYEDAMRVDEQARIAAARARDTLEAAKSAVAAAGDRGCAASDAVLVALAALRGGTVPVSGLPQRPPPTSLPGSVQR